MEVSPSPLSSAISRVKSKGAPGLAFETWDPSNQFPPGNISTGGFMGLRPAQADKKRLGPATPLYGTVVLSFLSSEVVTFLISRKRGCLSPSPPPQQSPCPLATILSFQQPSPCCHPERTRISYFTALTSATYVVLPKENHMHLTEATTLDRKSGEAEGSAVPRTFPGNVFICVDRRDLPFPSSVRPLPSGSPTTEYLRLPVCGAGYAGQSQ
jgi:hypothetical protein